MGTFEAAAQLTRYEGSLSTSVAPSGLVVSVADAKSHMSVDYSTDDTLIQAYIEAAVEYLETILGRDFIERTRVWKINDLRGDVILLPRSPVQSITSITYVDSAGVTQTEATSVYGLDGDRIPSLVFLKDGQSWSSVRGERNDVTITFVTGYASTGASPPTMDDIPDAIKHAIKLMVGDMYENREAQTVIPGQSFQANPAARMLVAPYMVHWH